MEQLGHDGHRVEGRWGFRYSLQTLPPREASVITKRKESKKKGMVNALERRKALTNEGAKSKRVKDEKTCQREAEGREERDRSSQVVSLSQKKQRVRMKIELR